MRGCDWRTCQNRKDNRPLTNTLAIKIFILDYLGVGFFKKVVLKEQTGVIYVIQRIWTICDQICHAACTSLPFPVTTSSSLAYTELREEYMFTLFVMFVPSCLRALIYPPHHQHSPDLPAVLYTNADTVTLHRSLPCHVKGMFSLDWPSKSNTSHWICSEDGKWDSAPLAVVR